MSSQNAANAFAKLSKCQQFTTKKLVGQNTLLLQTLLQSYQNVSNSQLDTLIDVMRESCKRFCKVIKMLAIHNTAFTKSSLYLAANAFATLSKCQQFTTEPVRGLNSNKLQTLLQSYQNVSNSQQRKMRFHVKNGCKRFCKVIKMLAIHNCCLANF